MSAPYLDKNDWRRLKEVLTTATKLPPAERVAIVDRSFVDDPALRDYALGMLDGYDTVTKPFDNGGAQGAATPERPAIAPYAPAVAGESVGHYRVLQRIGAGGMGVVYLAEDERLGRQVALKFLAPRERATIADSKAQLLAESRSVAILNHPAIVTLYDVLEVRDQLVAVMEYVEGRPLSHVIAGEPMPIGFALRLTGHLADALAYAHGRGIIHCDLKPANIHLLPSGSPKILDFGLARALAGSADRRTEVERPLLGTPGYMAPERLAGREATAASDVYALGVIFYELLTGLPPFKVGEDGGWFVDTVTATPLSPSALVAGIPAAVDDLALRCLAKNPRERLQPHELSRAISGVLLQLETSPIGELAFHGAHTTTAVANSVTIAAPMRWHERIVAAVSAAAATAGILTVFGFITSISYNQPLGLAGEYSSESAVLWPLWGARSMVAMIGWIAIMLLLYLTLAGVCRLLFATLPAFRRAVEPLRTAARRTVDRIRNTPASVVASSLLLAQLTVLAGTAWRFQAIVAAFDSFITRRSEALDAFRPQNRPEHRLLGEAVALEVLMFGLAWYWLARRTDAGSDRDARLLLWGGVAINAASLLIFQVAPYRVLWHNSAERVSYNSTRCYKVGQRLDDVVLFCPTHPPPWAQIVKATDPALREERAFESIFSGFDK